MPRPTLRREHATCSRLLEASASVGFQPAHGRDHGVRHTTKHARATACRLEAPAPSRREQVARSLYSYTVGQSHLNPLSRHSEQHFLVMMRLMRPNIPQLARMNPQLQFYMEQQRNT